MLRVVVLMAVVLLDVVVGTLTGVVPGKAAVSCAPSAIELKMRN